MDGLDEFEKSLAAERLERAEAERADKGGHRQQRHGKHRHHHRHHDHGDDGDRQHRHHRHRHRQEDDHEHRHKRSRHSRDDRADDSRPSGHKHHGNSSRERPSRRRHEREPGPSGNEGPSDAPVRDAWMRAPSSMEVEHIHRAERNKPPSPPPQPPKRIVHSRELNQDIRQQNQESSLSDLHQPAAAERKVDYVFGDSGSSWRMTKLRGVYTTAQASGRPVEDVAVERYGSLRDFDDAREEKEEMERRSIYGQGYKEKEGPTGDLYRARQEDDQTRAHDESAAAEADSGTVMAAQGAEAAQSPAAMDQTSLNRLRAQMMKAKLRRAPNAAQLEEEYNRAAALGPRPNANEAVVLGIMDHRQLAGTRGEVKAVDTRRGRERGLVEENNDMSVEDMVREERRTKNQSGGEGLRLAERIAKDGKYDNDLDYMDENAEKLARRVHKSEINLKNMAVNEFQKLTRALDKCPLCHNEDKGRPPVAPVVSLGTRVFLTLATEPEVSPGGAVIVPITHHRNLLECDDDEWEEIRNFMKSLTRMYHDQGREVIFYENAASPHGRMHAAMVAAPIPYQEGATAPAYFKEGILSSDEEWSQHKKVIDTAARARDGMGRMAFRRSIAKEMPYFHVWFSLDGGLGHIVENADRWPRGDLFAREVLGGICDAEPHLVKKQGRWVRGDARVDEWKRGWRKFDWTRVLEQS
ncbi:complexed with Cdc5 protein Cwf19 [Metarhizium album ARSEF 1941]|uniref:Complexed with Cdc5 protein Cwf19 n=1 Tax=Metarhizium album (strain ARSEF 1941) TaxID=1081103 RepID=A0A0B2WKV6_METAS|nr:complexed with Cdc5 protein Cwf19 [Metarhizium album ARSEF 1941]KHN94122.1 complexed with Cdc5 protein Cwf19 [Metarhizium album ARSEF 1941]